MGAAAGLAGAAVGCGGVVLQPAIMTPTEDRPSKLTKRRLVISVAISTLRCYAIRVGTR